jgi:alpha-L-rhamnosidase
LTMTAPYVGTGYSGFTKDTGPIGWQIVHPLLLRELFRYYGDRRIIEEQYETAQRWLEFVRAHTNGLIVDCGLSDHETLEEKPVKTTSTAFFFQGARLVSELAAILDREDDARRYAALAADIREAFVDELFKAESGIVGNGGQAAQATALYHELLPESSQRAAFDRLLGQLQDRDWKLSTGIFGTHYVLEVLTRMGQNDRAYRVVADKRFPGWGFMLERGATTLWEHWEFSDNVYSHNHPMFGSVDTWLYRGLVGIAPALDAVGFDKVVLRPQPVDGVTWVRARYDSIRGPIVSNWEAKEHTFDFEIELPPGVTGEVFLPELCDWSRARESGQPLDEAACVEIVNPPHLRVASGRYHFEAPIPPPAGVSIESCGN